MGLLGGDGDTGLLGGDGDTGLLTRREEPKERKIIVE